MSLSDPEKTITVGRYQLHRKIARGGMATIHIAHLVGDVGFSRVVAAKRLHPELAQDREFVAMFLDEARIASKVHHRNVVPVLDVVTTGDEVILVQDYVHGAPLAWLQKALSDTKTRMPVEIAVSIACQVLAGLHAAHETVDELGVPLRIVHRDVSPGNVMIATDGTARLVDFGVAKAVDAAHITRAGTFKGKIAYAAPEQLRGKATLQSDVYALAVVLWELLAGQRMFPSSLGQAAQVTTILRGGFPAITDVLAEERGWLGDHAWNQLAALQPVLEHGLSMNLDERWATALDMEAALGAVVTPAPSSEVAKWVKSVGKEFIEARDQVIAAEEESWRRSLVAIPRSTTAETPPIVAAEPPPPDVPPSLLQHPFVMISMCAILGIVLAFGIAFVGGGGVDRPGALPAVGLRAPAVSGDHTVARPPIRSLPAPATPAPPTLATPATPKLTTQMPASRPPSLATPRPAATRKPAPRIERDPPRPAPARAAPPARIVPSCNPPYYFQGAKKIFKPACL